MKNWLQWLELWFREQRDISACLVLSALPLPLYFVFILLPLLAQIQGQAQPIYQQDLVLFSELLLLGVCAVSSGIAVYCWQHRFSTAHYPVLSVLTTSVVLTGAITVAVGYGYKDSPLMLLCLGLLIMIRFLFKPNLYKPVFVVMGLIFVVCEIAFWTQAVPYAPLLKTPLFVGEQLTSWWAVWLRVIYTMIALPMVLLFMVLGYFITEEKIKLEQMVITDELTGIANRGRFMQQLETESRRHQRSQSPMCVLMCDVDHFKLVNDTWGHAAGDDVLAALGKVLRQTTRSNSDLVARFGGEEFVVLLPHTKLNHAKKIAEKIRQHLSHHIFGHGDDSFQVTLSIGVAQVEDGDGEKAVRLADKNLYLAKELGRNRVVCGPGRVTAQLCTI